MKKSPLVFLLAAVLAAPACNRSRSVSTPEGKVTYSEKGKDGTSVTFTGKKGESVTMDVDTGKLPADYPSDVPVYKDAKITMAHSISEKNGRTLVMETKDPTDRIAAFYKSGLESNGWKIEGTVAMGDLNLLRATKGGKQFVVQITNATEQRMIAQTLADKQ